MDFLETRVYGRHPEDQSPKSGAALQSGGGFRGKSAVSGVLGVAAGGALRLDVRKCRQASEAVRFGRIWTLDGRIAFILESKASLSRGPIVGSVSGDTSGHVASPSATPRSVCTLRC